MSPSSVKRASPGVDEAKNGAVEISEEDNLKLVELAKQQQKLDILLERKHIEVMQPYFERRREIIKTIPDFWSRALTNMHGLSMFLQHEMDQDAIKYLEDVWIVRDSVEPRCCTVEFYFKSNPYFSDSVIKKEFKYLAPPVPDNTPDENGITPAMVEFDWEQHVAPQGVKINWKDDSKNLTKLYGRVAAEEDGDNDDEDAEPMDPGSFFNFFEYSDDVMEIGSTIINELFPDAIEWFKGAYGLDDDESSEDEEDDDDEEEIDLEKPRKKKQKTA